MTGLGAATVLAASVPVGEAVTFWVLAPLALAAALGCVLVRNPVHSALFLVGVMVCLAVFYAVQSAPFLAVVQVIVYTGAIMILFLFVLMLVGVDAADSMVETLRGQRVAAAAAGGALLVLLVGVIGTSVRDIPVVGLEAANAAGNVAALALLMFGPYVVALEVVAALLVVATIAAMVLAHRESPPGAPDRRPSQKEQSRRRFDGTSHPAPMPGPGVYARHNAVDRPALLPDGSVVRSSVPPSLEPRRPLPGEPPRSLHAADSDRTALDAGVPSSDTRPHQPTVEARDEGGQEGVHEGSETSGRGSRRR